MREAFRAAYRAQVAGVPHATVVFAERAKHFVMFDDPAFVFATIDQFLASVAAGAPVVPGGPDDAPEGAAWIR
jgi:hypothetical protein